MRVENHNKNSYKKITPNIGLGHEVRENERFSQRMKKIEEIVCKCLDEIIKS